MPYAIVETSGTQLRVEPGRFYDVNRLEADEDSTITLDRVLFIEDDGTVSIGQPLVEGATVEATVMRHLRGRKIIVYKMRPKKKTRKKQGHRQDLTRIMIDSIQVGGRQLGSKKASASQPVVESATEAETADAPAPAPTAAASGASETE
ncbi:MAG: 50S ribosomal protein L21 [Kaiparowitsia implicata GSE-PSE-MK54-09C]|jgi:large subunit ribosomal protein L21|nr:50S ribosomal protein L21 [Kaiparowitsia implicata GSE-PSE-MK54-09C]